MSLNDHTYNLSPMANSGNPEEQIDEDAVDDFMNYQPESKKRRLTVEQVRSLERSFEIETKLEPEKKIQLAQELGLQPRQVAIWFQNRRARWKTKQLERDYSVLKASYDALKSDFERLQQENKNIRAELESLKEKLEEADCCKEDNHSDMATSTKVTSTIENSKKLAADVAGEENDIDIKPFSDITLLFKEKDMGLEKMDIKPFRVMLLNEKEGSFSPGSDCSANTRNEDKNPPHQILSHLAQASSSMKYPSGTNNIAGMDNINDQGLMHLAEALCGMGLPPKAYQQLFRVDEGYLHEDACNHFSNEEDQGAPSTLPWWEYWP